MLAAFLYYIRPRDEEHEPFLWGNEAPDEREMADIYANVGPFDVLFVTLNSVDEEVVFAHD